MEWRLAVATCLLCAVVSTSAMQPTLDRRGIEEAIQIGQSRLDAERARFHAIYRLTSSRPPFDWIDVITPYHRVAIAAEERARQGNRVFGQREAFAALAAAPNLLELVVELTFHPLNTFVGVPAYDVTLIGGQGKPIKAQYINRYPRFSPRTAANVPALPNPNAAPVLGTGQPMLGGTMVAQFTADALDANGTYDIVIADAGKEMIRLRMELAKMR
jgi:hypothetical protein